jgi:hypothetical protein
MAFAMFDFDDAVFANLHAGFRRVDRDVVLTPSGAVVEVAVEVAEVAAGDWFTALVAKFLAAL